MYSFLFNQHDCNAMMPLRELFQKNQAGFTVYSPDCTQSRLWGNLDHAIHQATGCHIVYRHWINHNINSIMAFYHEGDESTYKHHDDPQEAARRYNQIPAENLQYGHMVVKLFLSGPSLLTIWCGDNVIEKLLAVKGATHPAEAMDNTIRGRFWCDNAVCNLIHTSDNDTEAQRELKAVNLGHLLDEDMTRLELMETIAPPLHYIGHCSIAIVYDLVQRMTATTNRASIAKVTLPVSGDAKETNQRLTTCLQQIVKKTSHTQIINFISAYFAGDLIAVSDMMKQVPATQWEYFVIQCGAITRDKWTSQS